jgi:thiol-disulfide isomerase/thioredoxin
MKKKVIFCLFVLCLFGLFSYLLMRRFQTTFYLDDNYYGGSDMMELQMDELRELIKTKKSFAVFVYQPMCVTSSDFERLLNTFLQEKKIKIYKIAFSDIKDTELGKMVSYYPSFLIYHKGKLIDFLEADKDEDVPNYTSKEHFERWFTKYVKLKNILNEANVSLNTSTSSEENFTLIEDLEGVVKEDGKVNIYLFWGNGCPHCKKEFDFLESIKDEYGSYFNLYSFEVWYNEENAKILQVFAHYMNDEVTGVPYTIIGNLSFNGFGEQEKKEMMEAIKNQHQNQDDIYFDQIKKEK